MRIQTPDYSEEDLSSSSSARSRINPVIKAFVDMKAKEGEPRSHRSLRSHRSNGSPLNNGTTGEQGKIVSWLKHHLIILSDESRLCDEKGVTNLCSSLSTVRTTTFTRWNLHKNVKEERHLEPIFIPF